MSNTVHTYIPPMLIDRTITSYRFENGGTVAIVACGQVDTLEALDMIDVMIAEKRKEIARRKIISRPIPATTPEQNVVETKND